MKASFFNFSHDLALAHNVANYTPPRNVQIMERDLAPLASLLPAAELTYNEYAPVWGWDISLVRRLHRAGYKDLPTAEQLAEIRRLSSRLTAVELLPAIRRRLPEGSTVGESWTGQTPSGRGANHSPGGEFIVKADYSGSGRGVRVVHGSRFMVQGEIIRTE